MSSVAISFNYKYQPPEVMSRRPSTDSNGEIGSELRQIATIPHFQSLAVIASRTPSPELATKGTPSKEDSPRHTFSYALPCAIVTACATIAASFFAIYHFHHMNVP